MKFEIFTKIKIYLTLLIEITNSQINKTFNKIKLKIFIKIKIKNLKLCLVRNLPALMEIFW
jgi:hypothetical protein